MKFVDRHFGKLVLLFLGGMLGLSIWSTVASYRNCLEHCRRLQVFDSDAKCEWSCTYR